MWERRLHALGYPSPSTFRGATQGEASTLAAWLEDKHIRQLPIEDRAALRKGDGDALLDYLNACEAPSGVLADFDQLRWPPICSWLLCFAVQCEYDDNRAACDAHATPSLAANPELLALASELGVKPGANAMGTLQSALQNARSRAAAQAAQVRPPAAPAPRAPTKGELVPASETSFPLGFATGDAAVDEAARVLRMLHVRDLRALQDAVNDAVVAVQEITADPKTDSRRGKVGR